MICQETQRLSWYIDIDCLMLIIIIYVCIFTGGSGFFGESAGDTEKFFNHVKKELLSENTELLYQTMKTDTRQRLKKQGIQIREDCGWQQYQYRYGEHPAEQPGRLKREDGFQEDLIHALQRK